VVLRRVVLLVVDPVADGEVCPLPGAEMIHLLRARLECRSLLALGEPSGALQRDVDLVVLVASSPGSALAETAIFLPFITTASSSPRRCGEDCRARSRIEQVGERGLGWSMSLIRTTSKFAPRLMAARGCCARSCRAV